jgi:capsular polysaccharide biosynthesis protein
MARIPPWLERSRRHFRVLKPLWQSSRRWQKHLPPPSALGIGGPHRPAGFHYTFDDYLAANAGAGAATEVYAAEKFLRPMPQTLDGGPAHPVFAVRSQAAIPAARVFQLHGARYWGYNAGVIIGRDNRLIGEFSPDVWGMESHRAFSQWRYPPCRKLTGTVAVISTAAAERNYGHWTMDLLPRFHYLERAGFGPDKVDHYVINHTGRPYEIDSFRRLGLPPEKIVRADESLHFTADHLVTTTQKGPVDEVARYAVKWLREGFSRVPLRPSRRLYLTRRNCGFRRLLNEAELEPMLRAQGFEILTMDALPQADQIALFAEARIMLGPHGSAFTNAVYAPTSAVMAELIPLSYVDPAFWAQATASGQPHFAEFAPGTSGRDYTHVCRQDDFRVEPVRFTRWLEWVLAESEKSASVKV